MDDIGHAQHKYIESRTKKKFARIVLAGNHGVGKTSILNRLTCDTFDETMSSTLGADLVTKSFTIKKNSTCYHDDEDRSCTCADTITSVYMHIWDTAGQERFMSMCGMYFRQADMIMLCYDTTKTHTLLDLEIKWWPVINMFVNVSDIVLFVVGTKCDIVGSDSSNQYMHAEQNDIIQNRWLAPEGQGIWTTYTNDDDNSVDIKKMHRPKIVRHYTCSAKNSGIYYNILDIFQESANIFQKYCFETTIKYSKSTNREYMEKNQSLYKDITQNKSSFEYCCTVQ